MKSEHPRVSMCMTSVNKQHIELHQVDAQGAVLGDCSTLQLECSGGLHRQQNTRLVAHSYKKLYTAIT